MATTNMPSSYSGARADDARMQQDRAAVETDHGPDIDDLHEQAIDALNYRSDQLHGSMMRNDRIRLEGELRDADPQVRERRLAEFDRNAREMQGEMRKKAMAVYDDAIRRRGRRQAAMDQLQGAVGLPVEPAQRQREVERRSAEGAAMATAQSGSGTFADNLEGRRPALDQRPDEFFGDRMRPEFNSAIRQGHGQNIAAQTIAAQTLMTVAPNAPLTQQNVLDPHGAAERHQGVGGEAVGSGQAVAGSWDWGDRNPSRRAPQGQEEASGWKRY